MHYLRYSAMAAALLLAVSGAGVSAASLKVLDQQGKALTDAVILVDGVAQRPALSTSMDQIDLQFQPRVLVVPAGTEVGFPNGDNVRHHVYSFSPTKPFELRLFHGSEAPPVTFEQSGPVVLGCNIHDSMIGYILVTDSPWYAISNPAGELDLEHLPTGEVLVSWWHPTLGDAPPVTLGSMDLHSSQNLTLAVDVGAEAAAEKPLSPLQKRFNKAAGKYAN
ncbi:methylamine utilization protein [uncultured Halopseudomonas sp.]|uniref:methylamine utilization protein n=1 Tax=uncultured Halopseudomonas sp. TaxID=2901193 RepID=UPI0030EBE7F2|tara:strand:+ start:23129 stop:23791 length:663 start_codon:yes stop_codon:yes gene_type:complete